MTCVGGDGLSLLLSWVCLHRARHPSRPPLDTGAFLRLLRYLLRIVYADSMETN
jgi:hypothetical protein